MLTMFPKSPRKKRWRLIARSPVLTAILSFGCATLLYGTVLTLVLAHIASSPESASRPAFTVVDTALVSSSTPLKLEFIPTVTAVYQLTGSLTLPDPLRPGESASLAALSTDDGGRTYQVAQCSVQRIPGTQQLPPVVFFAEGGFPIYIIFVDTAYPEPEDTLHLTLTRA